MSIVVYKCIHFSGLLLLFLSLGLLAATYVFGGIDSKLKKGAGAAHGLSLFLVFLGGFGLLAKTGISWPWPGWVITKLAVWLFLGAAPALLKRKPQNVALNLILIFTAGFLAVFLVMTKIF